MKLTLGFEEQFVRKRKKEGNPHREKDVQETTGVEKRRMNFRKYSELDIGRLKLLGNRGDSKNKVRNNLHILLVQLQARMKTFPT